MKIEGQGPLAAALRNVWKAVSPHLVNASGFPGWSRDAQGRWIPPRISSTALLGPQAWDIAKTSDAISFRAGSIRSAQEYTGAEVTLVDATASFPTPSDQHVAYIDFEFDYANNELGTTTLKVGERWANWPAAYSFTTYSGDAVLDRYRLLLWYFRSADAVPETRIGRVGITDGLVAVRSFPPTGIFLTQTTYRSGSDRVPVLIAIPAGGSVLD